MGEHFTYKSFSWSFGTTSFRMADFHRKVEEQLTLLDEFWHCEENKNRQWKAPVQIDYYDFIYQRGFLNGKIQDNPDKKAKTARQKTSGLADIGLVDADRRLTQVGKRLLKMSKKGDFRTDNAFQIPSDSFLYLKQLLKTAYSTDEGIIRPFLIFGQVLKGCDGYLSDEEFTFLLPLCMNQQMTQRIIHEIRRYRHKEVDLDTVIVSTVLSRYNYPAALDFFIKAEKTPETIMTIGMNRDGIRHDFCYVALYEKLRQVYLASEEDYLDDNEMSARVKELMQAARGVKNRVGTLWRSILFISARRYSKKEDLAPNLFDDVKNDEDFDRCFFNYLHLNKIKSNLKDYKDLNRRYLEITDAVIFCDGKVTFTPIFENFFSTSAENVFDDAYKDCKLLMSDCDMQQIHNDLIFKENDLINVFNLKNHTNLNDIREVYEYLENDRYDRFRKMIDNKFPTEVILTMLDYFENRQHDEELVALVGAEADIPTIFEYIVGVAWYRISGYCGKILDDMNLSLDVNLLPRTHAGAGESDIVYHYPKTEDYPAHTLLIECTLMAGTVQRHGEMEPVTRHLANYMIDEDMNTYCAFVSNNLHASVISDFRMRKFFPFYRNDTEHVDGMKIIPFHTNELKQVIKKQIRYSEIYNLFENAYKADYISAPPQWYKTCIREVLESQ